MHRSPLKKLLVSLLFVILIQLYPSDSSTLIWFKTPYIQNVSTTAASILWHTPFRTVGELHYKTGQERYFTIIKSKNKRQHRMRLRNLEPNTRYYYKLYYDGLIPSETYSFKTAPTRDNSEFTFAVMGDTGSLKIDQFLVSKELKKYAFDFLLHTGDVVYSSGEENGYNWRFFFQYQYLLKRVPFFMTIGNHDAKTDNGAPYLKIFDLPHNNPQNTELYYSFEWGNALFISLDTIVSALDHGTEQYTWLEDTLAASDHEWKFVFFHIPVFGSSPRGINKRNRRVLAPLFEKYQVDLVLSGHDHLYERTKPIRETETEGPGVTYIISGGGGARVKWHDIIPRDFSAVVKSKYHFLIVSVKDNRLVLRAIDKSGDIFDSHRIIK